MKKLIALLAITLAGLAQAAQFEGATFAESADGTTSATAFIPKGDGLVHITDLAYRLDGGLTTGTVDIRRGEVERSVTSATSASTQIWFDNDPTIVSGAEYVILFDDSANTYYLYRCVTTAANSISVQETTVATTTSDKLYSCRATVRRHAPIMSNSTGAVDIWLPSDLPSALTIDGNTTSCRISVGGTRVKN